MANNLPAFRDHMLPGEATPFERIISATTIEPIRAIPVPLKLLNDPYKAPFQFLDQLAFEVGVDIWNEDWDELKKRSVIAATIRTKEILGTLAGIEAYINIEGGTLLDVVTPPQTPFISEGLSDAEMADWLSKLPQLRVYFGDDSGTADPSNAFIGGNAFIGSSFVTEDKSSVLRGRRAYIYDPSDGSETRITLKDLGLTGDSRTEQVSIPGRATGNEAIIGHSFIGNSFVVDELEDAPTTLTYTLTSDTFEGLDAGTLALTLAQSFGAVNAKFDRVPVTSTARTGQLFIGHSFIGNGFVQANEAEIDFYDRVYIASQNVPTPLSKTKTFIGHARLEMEPYRAEMLIDAHETKSLMVAFEGSFIGNCYVQEQDDTKRKRILRAIELAKSGRDRVFVDFQTTRILSFDDAPRFDGSFKFGQRVPRHRL